MEITEAPEIPENAPPEAVPPEAVPPKVTADLAEEITKDIETGKKPKRPRSEKQKAAFIKAREALAEKRKAAAEVKALNKKKPGRPRVPPKAKEDPVAAQPKKEKKEKKVQYVLEESSSSSSSEEEEEVVYVKRSKGRKPRKKKGQKIVYVSSSSEEELVEDTHDYSEMLPPDPQFASLYSFV